MKRKVVIVELDSKRVRVSGNESVIAASFVEPIQSVKHDGETIENLEAEKMGLVREKRKMELKLTDVRLFYKTREHEFQDEMTTAQNKQNKEIAELDALHLSFQDERNKFNLQEVRVKSEIMQQILKNDELNSDTERLRAVKRWL